MSKSLPWEEIKTPKDQYSVRRISIDTALPVYIGKNNEGSCLLIIELEGDHTAYFQKNRVSVFGLEIDLKSGEKDGFQNLVLLLEKHIDKDLFEVLCLSLISTVNEISNSDTCLMVSLAHLKRWKGFMSGRKRPVLSRQEIFGLFAELTFMKSLLAKHKNDHNKIIDSWEGPDQSHQDFIFSNVAVEVKAISGRERNTVRISSEDQLAGLTEHVYLKIYRLGDMPESAKSLNLNEIVNEIEEALIAAEDRDIFSDKLAKTGYIPIEEYNSPSLIVLSEQTYVVSEDFPRICRSSLPEGISKVNYELSLDKITTFSCENEIDWKR